MKDQTLKLFVTLLVGVLIVVSCHEEQMTPLQLSNKIVKEYSQKKSLSYDINYRIKFFSETIDTHKVSAKIDLIRVESDTIFGGYIWIDADSISRYYNTKAFYLIEHKENKITKFPKNKTSALTSNVINEAHRIYFLDPIRLNNGINDTTNSITITEDELDSNDVWKFRYDFSDNDETNNSWKNIWISKENYTIPKINYSADSHGENQYNQWDLFNLSFDSVTIKDLNIKLQNFIAKYEMSEYDESNDQQLITLSIGAEIPNLDGIVYPDQSTVDLHSYRNKLTLYDFWYIDCPPCIKAIPHLNSIHNKYKEMGLSVVGVNPINNNEKDLKRMPNFLSHNTIEYPIVFIDRKESAELKIPIYPTFYLVDQNGNIIHTELGFDEKSLELLEIELDEYLTN